MYYLFSFFSETQAALHSAEEKSNSEVLPSSKYSLLLEKVQTIPALSESNRWLRDERDQLKSKLVQNEAQLKEYETKLTPLQVKNFVKPFVLPLPWAF